MDTQNGKPSDRELKVSSVRKAAKTVGICCKNAYWIERIEL